MRLHLVMPPAPPLVREDDLYDWSLDNAIRRHVTAVMEYCGGNRTWAASELGVSRQTLHDWLVRWADGLPGVKTG